MRLQPVSMFNREVGLQMDNEGDRIKEMERAIGIVSRRNSETETNPKPKPKPNPNPNPNLKFEGIQKYRYTVSISSILKTASLIFQNG